MMTNQEQKPDKEFKFNPDITFNTGQHMHTKCINGHTFDWGGVWLQLGKEIFCMDCIGEKIAPILKALGVGTQVSKEE